MEKYFLLTIFLQLLSLTAAQESGPYNIVLESITNCQDRGTGDISVVSKARKEGKDIFHTGVLSLPFGLTDGFQAKGEANILRDGQWEKIGLISELEFSEACSSMKSLVSIWFGILKAAKVKNVDCPIKKGVYHFVDYQVNGSISGFDKLTFGKYRARLIFSDNGKVIGCIAYFANLVPV